MVPGRRGNTPIIFSVAFFLQIETKWVALCPKIDTQTEEEIFILLPEDRYYSLILSFFKLQRMLLRMRRRSLEVTSPPDIHSSYSSSMCHVSSSHRKSWLYTTFHLIWFLVFLLTLLRLLPWFRCLFKEVRWVSGSPPSHISLAGTSGTGAPALCW